METGLAAEGKRRDYGENPDSAESLGQESWAGQSEVRHRRIHEDTA